MDGSEARPARLPAGRHGLSREEVMWSQRTRILMALAETMVEKGYVATTVADVLRAARVSRETFYQQFSSKEDCFMTAFEIAMQYALAGTFAPVERGVPPLERFSRGLRVYLDTVAAQPAFARLFLIEVYAAGPAAWQRRFELQRREVERMQKTLGVRSKRDRFAAEALVSATVSMVTARLAADDLDGVRALHAPLTELAGRLLAKP
jgi:AcrR family transcriptional regulator